VKPSRQSTRMRILVLSYLNLGFAGGAEHWIVEAVTRWSMQHDVEVVTTSFGPRRTSVPPIPEGVRLTEVGVVDGSTLPNPGGLSKIRKGFEWADVAYFVYQPGGLEVAASLLQMATGTPVLAGHHGALLWYETEPQLPRRIRWMFEVLGPRNIRLGRTLYAHQATNSRDAKLLRRFHVRRVFEVPSAIECDDFEPIQKRHNFTMAFTGSFVHQKGVDRLPEVVEPVLASIPDAQFEFSGDGPCRDFLTRLLPLTGVHYLGFVDRQQQKQLLGSAHVYLAPSRYETFSKSAMEAMASGTPVVAMRVGGLEDYIVNGENGFLADDSRGFTQALLKMHETWEARPADYLRMCENARSTSLEYDWGKIGPRLDSVLEEVRLRG
jgi:glycosyltransferase involved in cell wall biosynthesis